MPDRAILDHFPSEMSSARKTIFTLINRWHVPGKPGTLWSKFIEQSLPIWMFLQPGE
jgi:hypothetical protein